jgi:hypothetical protein
MPQVRPKALIICAHILISTVLAGTHAAAGVVFNTSYGAGLTALAGSDPALAGNVQTGFAQAEAIWSSLLGDNITLNFMLDWQDLDSGTLASASSPNEYLPYGNVRAALSADRTSANDFTAVANMPPSPAIGGYTNARDGTRIFTAPNASLASTVLSVDRSNAKALGLLAANDAGLDATIRFNSDYFDDWSFNHAPTPGLYDFVGVALHEIGHALGFTSGVSSVDSYTGVGPNANVDLNGPADGIGNGDNIPIFSVLDMFRHSDDSNLVSPQALELGTGGTPYFQIDGSTALGNFSTGEHNGDGRQPSHWKSTVAAVMRPASSRGGYQHVTELDLMAIDVIGYQIVPEPSSYVLAITAAIGVILVGRRRRLTAC